MSETIKYKVISAGGCATPIGTLLKKGSVITVSLKNHTDAAFYKRRERDGDIERVAKEKK